jgi:hypothetical protein
MQWTSSEHTSMMRHNSYLETCKHVKDPKAVIHVASHPMHDQLQTDH